MTHNVDTALETLLVDTAAYPVNNVRLLDTLKNTRPLILFALTDDALSQRPKNTLVPLLKNVRLLSEVLTYHLITGNTMAVNLAKADLETKIPLKPNLRIQNVLTILKVRRLCLDMEYK